MERNLNLHLEGQSSQRHRWRAMAIGTYKDMFGALLSFSSYRLYFQGFYESLWKLFLLGQTLRFKQFSSRIPISSDSERLEGNLILNQTQTQVVPKFSCTSPANPSVLSQKHDYVYSHDISSRKTQTLSSSPTKGLGEGIRV